MCDYDHERIEVLKSILTPMRTNSLHLKERRLREKLKWRHKRYQLPCGDELQDDKFVLVSVKNGRSVEVFTPSNGNQLRLRVNESALPALQCATQQLNKSKFYEESLRVLCTTKIA